MKPIWIIALLVMNVLWAAAYSCFKLLAPVMDAGTLTTLRFGLSGLTIVACWRWIPGAMPKGLDLFRAGAMGTIVFVLAPRLQVTGVQLGRAGDAAIMMAFDPVIAAVAATLFLGERVRWRRWLGFGLGFAGVATLAELWRPGFRFPSLSANALILLSFVCESAYSVIGRRLLERAHPLKVLATSLLLGSAVNLLIDGTSAVRTIGQMRAADWIAMGYLVLVCTVLGYSLWFYAIRRMPVNLVASTVFMQPVAGVLFALFLLGETPRWSQFVGAVFIVSGMLAGLRRDRFEANSSIAPLNV